ncbi:maleylpyruvate isomerase family mycothiol-dependent enzyme [Actinokineospora sp. HBU206404]|uniref:Maleylpyruvate isomerase family mycothiol-dependent enzyme n=2 Tax=Actinokineospora xionganensis TaxID=2684470 RepID=A0ABR7LBA5_9PSEU|nr:maleylpyruvate isomerase family mycothiol-dependent enzyme [Actinokineospora xionganensis]
MNGTTTAATLAAVREATAVLTGVVERFAETDFTRPSLLPGWTRGHVVTHLARNADALVNLLTWARTGIEHAAYPSRADRDADIADGASRLGQIQREDLIAACDRFMVEATRLGHEDWAARVQHPSGDPIVAARIPQMRLFEVWTHLVDLDADVGFDAVPNGHLDLVLDRALLPHLNRTDGHPLRLTVSLPDGSERSWELAIAPDGGSEVSGPAAAALTWLTGRGKPADLVGPIPDLGPWG